MQWRRMDIDDEDGSKFWLSIFYVIVESLIYVCSVCTRHKSIQRPTAINKADLQLRNYLCVNVIDEFRNAVNKTLEEWVIHRKSVYKWVRRMIGPIAPRASCYEMEIRPSGHLYRVVGIRTMCETSVPNHVVDVDLHFWFAPGKFFTM